MANSWRNATSPLTSTIAKGSEEDPERNLKSPLSSTIAMGSEEDIKLFCQPCDRSGPRFPAFGYCINCKEYLCQNCFSGHKKVAPHTKHILLDKDAMPISQISQTAANVVTGASDELTTPCPVHNENMLTFYCYHHKSFICRKCKNSDHTSAHCDVAYIPDLSEQTLNGKEFSDTVENLEDIINQSEKLKLEYEILAKESNSSLEKAISAMTNFRRELNNKMDELETTFLNEAQKVSRDNFTEMRKVETALNKVTESTKSLLGSVKVLNKTKNGKKLFMKLKSARKDMQTNASLLTNLAKSKDKTKKEYAFKANETVAISFNQEKAIGKLVQKSELSTCPSEICVKTPEDRNNCWITGMTLLSPDKLILADSSNKSVKMADVNRRTVTAQINVDGAPCDVTKVSNDELAVTLPDEGQMNFISVISNKLVLKQCLKTEGKFCGISYCSGKGFAVCFDNPAKVGILDIKGNLRSTIKANSKGKDIFSGPDYVKTNRDYIFVSDRGKKAVIRLNWNGEVTGEYSSNMRCPQGLALSVDGAVFVCDHSSNSVRAVSPDFSSGTVLIPDIKRPCAVCLCDKSGQLFISRHTQNKSYDNCVQISKMT
ncbi:uncharacterized protein LOC123527237 [Mercenaria mercenaria]|uniref:uncharacterized protein LOC123527237 n=1 Tax=Mercenaria mercenaria TaxID=6596 RepID=UPI001E1DC192|nr:uncharacterized protein LOC123527237 [Mercenaria mercenaria]